MNELLITAIFFGLCAAMFGMLWAVVLAEDDTPLNPLFKWLTEWQERGGWRSWVTSPLGGCVLCFSGQLALWAYSIIIPWAWDAVSIFLHLVSASAAVLFAAVLNTGYRWLKKSI